MLALTLWRPWPTLIGRGIKKIENRPWAPGARLWEGARFAIHAGKGWDERCQPMAERLGVPASVFDGSEKLQCAVVAVVTFAGLMTSSNDPWFFGPFGWILEEPFVLPRPVACPGMQKLWQLPPTVEAEVLAQCQEHQL